MPNKMGHGLKRMFQITTDQKTHTLLRVWHPNKEGPVFSDPW